MGKVKPIPIPSLLLGSGNPHGTRQEFVIILRYIHD